MSAAAVPGQPGELPAASGLWDRLAVDERIRGLLVAAAARPGDSFLFAGPPGAGTVAAARTFAASVVCPDACGVCPCCLRALGGSHADVAWYEPEGLTYPLDLIREMVAAAAQTPLEGRRRVTVVEEADRITERSQNALLKALEDAGPSVTWVLVADALESFLPTVLSRCQVIEFPPVPETKVRVLLEERFGVEPGQAAHIVRIARGNLETAVALAGDPRAAEVRDLAIRAATDARRRPGWAIRMAEQVLVLAKEAREQRGRTLEADLHALEEVLGAGRGAASARRRMVERHKRVLRRVELQTSLDFLSWLGAAARDLAAVAAGALPSVTSTPDHAEQVSAAAPARPVGFWLDLVDATLEGRRAILENANPGMVVESVLLRLAREGAAREA